MIRTREKIMLAAALSFACALSALAAGYSIDWYTIDGGGKIATVGGDYELSGTIGQPDASATAALTGGGYSLMGGFWAVIPVCTSFAAPDLDHDCDVDIDDLTIFIDCAKGPGVPGGVGPACVQADFNGDSAVDAADFAVWQRCLSGGGIAADPNCAN